MTALRSYHFETEDDDEPVDDAVNLAPVALSLKQLLDTASRAVTNAFDGFVWVVAEIHEISPPRGGHVYITLVEKNDSGALVAKTKGNLWQARVRPVLGGFQEATGTALTVGMKALIQVEPNMHAVHGFAVTIIHIDPSYTLGELERERRLTIERLTKEGLLDKNKQLEMPLVAQRIAVISSSGAAGYEDFVHQLTRNSAGYKFKYELFHAVVQGESAPKSIMDALRAIVRRKDEFDVVVVIRGGGSKIDLHCFDGYEVASAVAWMKLPVITGIGHERDESVTDLVAHTKCKTPTAVAEFLICLASDFEDEILTLRQCVVQASRNRLQVAQSLVERIAGQMRELVTKSVKSRAAALERIVETLRAESLLKLERERGMLQRIVDKIELLDPINVVKRGYSLVYSADTGKLVRDSSDIKVGSSLRVKLAKSEFSAQVTDITKAIENEGTE